MVDLKHKCIVGTARSKLTILKRLRAMKHPSTKAPLVRVHRIIIDRSSIAEEVRGLQNPGVGLIGICTLKLTRTDLVSLCALVHLLRIPILSGKRQLKATSVVNSTRRRTWRWPGPSGCWTDVAAAA